MSLEEILALDLSDKEVLIIGLAATGKTYLTDKLRRKLPHHILLSTDDYIHFGHDGALYGVTEALSWIGDSYALVEGVLGYRLLRKYAQGEDIWTPDVVIECVVPQWRQEKIYRDEREGKSKRGVQSQNKGLQTILNEYEFLAEWKPEWITFNNDWND